MPGLRHGAIATAVLLVIAGSAVQAWWYNPRTGDATKAGTFENRGTRVFVCPAEGFGADWVLVLDDPVRKFPKLSAPHAANRI